MVKSKGTKRKLSAGLLSMTLLTAVLFGSSEPLVKAEKENEVEHFLNTDVDLIQAQFEFTKSNFYSGMLKNRDIESPMKFTDRAYFTKSYWGNMDNLNAQIRQINEKWYMETDEGKKKLIFEQELIPKLETLLTFVDSGEKVMDEIMQDVENGHDVNAIQKEEVMQSWASAYAFAEDYLQGMRLMVYAYQELYKFNHIEKLDENALTPAQQSKNSEISQYLYIAMLMNAYLFDPEKFLEKTQMQN